MNRGSAARVGQFIWCLRSRASMPKKMTRKTENGGLVSGAPGILNFAETVAFGFLHTFRQTFDEDCCFRTVRVPDVLQIAYCRGGYGDALVGSACPKLIFYVDLSAGRSLADRVFPIVCDDSRGGEKKGHQVRYFLPRFALAADYAIGTESAHFLSHMAKGLKAKRDDLAIWRGRGSVTGDINGARCYAVFCIHIIDDQPALNGYAAWEYFLTVIGSDPCGIAAQLECRPFGQLNDRVTRGQQKGDDHGQPFPQCTADVKPSRYQIDRDHQSEGFNNKTHLRVLTVDRFGDPIVRLAGRAGNSSARVACMPVSGRIAA